MRIRMLETRRDTEDGFILRQLERQQEYELGDYLARRLIAAGRAVAVVQDGIPESSTLTEE